MNAIIERDSLESINPQNATAFFLENLRRVQDGQPDLGILRAEWLPIEFDDEQEWEITLTIEWQMGDYEDALYAQIHARLLQTSTRSLVESILECNDEADDLSQEARSWPASHRNKNAALTKRWTVILRRNDLFARVGKLEPSLHRSIRDNDIWLLLASNQELRDAVVEEVQALIVENPVENQEAPFFTDVQERAERLHDCIVGHSVTFRQKAKQEEAAVQKPVESAPKKEPKIREPKKRTQPKYPQLKRPNQASPSEKSDALGFRAGTEPFFGLLQSIIIFLKKGGEMGRRGPVSSMSLGPDTIIEEMYRQFYKYLETDFPPEYTLYAHIVSNELAEDRFEKYFAAELQTMFAPVQGGKPGLNPNKVNPVKVFSILRKYIRRYHPTIASMKDVPEAIQSGIHGGVVIVSPDDEVPEDIQVVLTHSRKDPQFTQVLTYFRKTRGILHSTNRLVVFRRIIEEGGYDMIKEQWIKQWTNIPESIDTTQAAIDMGGGILDFYQTVPLGHIAFSVYGNLCIQHNLCHHPLEALDVFRQQYFENGALSEDQKRELNQVLESFAPYQHFLAGELAVMLMQSTADVVSPEELQSLPLVEILRRSIESIIETIEVLESIHQS